MTPTNRERNRIYYNLNKDKVNVQKTTYYAKNKKRILNKRKAKRDELLAYYKAYYKKNRKRILANQKKQRRAGKWKSS